MNDSPIQDGIPEFGPAIDEMVDGRHRLRPHWRLLIGTFGGLGPEGIAERAQRLDRAFADEGVSSILPGASSTIWRCDPVPLPIPAAEFASLSAGLAQRARLLEAVLADLYGPRSLLEDGTLPPALVYANPGWLRPYHAGPAPTHRLLDFYAADVLRGPDGTWRVLADRTAGAGGVGYAQENRRLLARVMPEAFRGLQVRQLRPFFDVWQDALQRLSPGSGGATGAAVAMLTAGTSSPHWFEHMFIARALSCALVEPGDLTVRGGILYLKTLRGLQRIDVVLRRVDGRLLDPLEHEVFAGYGVPGLMDAARAGTLRVTNDPGSGAVEAPALAAWLPALSLKLLGEPLQMQSVPTMWLGESRARELLLADPSRWLLRAGLDGRAPAVALGSVSEAGLAAALAEVAAKPWAFAATACLPPSVVPSVGPEGLVPRAVILRMFLVHDGTGWRAMEGGLARVVDPDAPFAAALPGGGLAKDVWILSEDSEEMVGPPASVMPPVPIRRMPGELPSRAADNLYWLGRTVERLEGAARLIRSTLQRLGRETLLPHELAELQMLARCLTRGRLISSEARPGPGSLAPLSDGLLAAVRDRGPFSVLLTEAARLIEAVRDRVTTEMYAAFIQALRAAHLETQRVRRSLDGLSHAMTEVVRFSALVSGIAAESMVRAGGWLFLDLGRRLERAIWIADAAADALDVPQPRIEAGLRLLLELCDSSITYRTRYLTVVQPAPVLDLVLADTGNPRGLCFQLDAIRNHLQDLSGWADASLPATAADLLDEASALVQRVAASRDQSAEAALLPTPLRNLETQLAELSNQLKRRYFTLLPAARTYGSGQGEPEALRGAA